MVSAYVTLITPYNPSLTLLPMIHHTAVGTLEHTAWWPSEAAHLAKWLRITVKARATECTTFFSFFLTKLHLCFSHFSNLL